MNNCNGNNTKLHGNKNNCFVIVGTSFDNARKLIRNVEICFIQKVCQNVQFQYFQVFSRMTKKWLIYLYG